LGRNPVDRSMYVFCNRGRDKLKLLIWHLNGYWLLYKRLEKQRFQWPDWFDGESLRLTAQQLDYLLDGYNLNGMRPHKALRFAHTL
jgi:transposase